MVAKSIHTKQHGTSLIETLSGLVIAAVVATLAASAWANQANSRRLLGHIDELIQDMHWARSEAVARGASVRLSLVNDGVGQACYVIHTGEANACGCDASSNQSCSATAQALKVVKLDSTKNLSLSYTSKSILWNSTTGTVTPTGTVKIEHPNVGRVHVVVNLMGRIRTCSPSGLVRGHPVC
jgi:type IV fimbrial biogenesis protein FimT